MLCSLTVGGKQQLVMLREGSEPRQLVEAKEPAMTPAAVLGGGSLAFILGAGDDRRIALASLRDGRIQHRFPALAADVSSIVATPDGAKLYYASGGSIWEQNISGGEPRRFTDGTDATLDRSGQNLYVKRNDASLIELYRVPITVIMRKSCSCLVTTALLYRRCRQQRSMIVAESWLLYTYRDHSTIAPRFSIQRQNR